MFILSVLIDHQVAMLEYRIVVGESPGEFLPATPVEIKVGLIMAHRGDDIWRNGLEPIVMAIEDFSSSCLSTNITVR